MIKHTGKFCLPDYCHPFFNDSFVGNQFHVYCALASVLTRSDLVVESRKMQNPGQRRHPPRRGLVEVVKTDPNTSGMNQKKRALAKINHIKQEETEFLKITMVG